MVQKHWLLTWKSPSDATPCLEDCDLLIINLIDCFNNFDIITTQDDCAQTKSINLMLGILYIDYTLEIFSIFYKLNV